MNVDEKIELVAQKLSKLRDLDNALSIHGASSHKYCLNRKLSEDQITDFEDRHMIQLPEEYRAFLLHIADGGAGPYYGIETLENSLFSDLDNKRPGEFVNPSIPFAFEAAWNMQYEGDEEDEQAYEEHEKEYFSKKWETGILRLCNYGCGVWLNLVVAGTEKGNIWVDDRGNDGGIYPDQYFEQTTRTTFLEWYLLWLNQSLIEVKAV